MIVGTAGHIDHGKTALIKALTGTDADRLVEEKARGITIDLGFAYADLGGGAITGFVDVPGHERLIHTMLAGAGGIDFALLAVAADDGVMPQTREHLAILDLIGIDRGVIALTKSTAKELASRHIRVNAVAPGFIESKMTDVLTEDVRNKMLEAIPLQRFGKPADVAQAVLFLVSEASAYITGQVLTVSGGMVM